jgi:transcriptional regulator with XRE-family HTH domain
MRKRVSDSNYYIGANIRTARMRADLTQEKMSELIGVTPQYLSDLERGLVGTSIPTLIRICTELNVSADFILFGSSRDADTANSTLIEKLQRLPKYKADMVETSLNILLEAMDMDPDQRTGK